MLASRRMLALAGALAAALSFSAPAGAAETCGNADYSYAGLATGQRVRGIRAVLTPLSAPEVEAGQVTAWVGIGRARAHGKRGLLRAGLLATAGSNNRLFYEVKRRDGWRVYVGPFVAEGERHRVAVVQMRARRGWWRVWLDRRPISEPIFIPRSQRGRPGVVTAENWSHGSQACNRFRYRFGRISISARANSWRRPARARIVEDLGYAVSRPSRSSLLAANRQVAPSPPPVLPVPTPPSPACVLTGDWETGDWTQWSGVHHRLDTPIEDQFQIVGDPLRQGAYAARFVVRPGDKFGSSSGERSEVLCIGSNEGEGDEYWYAWSTLFPADWTAPKDWGIFLQWHSGFPIPPPIAFNAREDTAVVSVNTGDINENGVGQLKTSFPLLGTLSKGLWNDFVVHVRWSGTDGAIAVWHRVEGQGEYTLVLDLTGIPTLQAKSGVVSQNYFKMGLYRNDDPSKVNTVYHDDFHRWHSAPGAETG